MWSCPICRQPLELEGKTYSCVHHHCFDLAHSGYVNLLPANRKHSKDPGDNRAMVQARREFLEQGYYLPLVQALCRELAQWAIHTPWDSLTLLDAGCGEGYYTAHIQHHLQSCGKPVEILGVDISKAAVEKAAKRHIPNSHFAVASVFDLPVLDGSCQGMINLFAPFQLQQAQRVLEEGGLLLLVIPGADHLWELKQAVYDTPYRNEQKDPALEGFVLQKQCSVTDRVMLSNPKDIQALFQMTPYSYKTSQRDMEKLMQLQQLETTIAFELLLYQKVG